MSTYSCRKFGYAEDPDTHYQVWFEEGEQKHLLCFTNRLQLFITLAGPRHRLSEHQIDQLLANQKLTVS